VEIPEHLVARWRRSPEGVAWLDRLSVIVQDVEQRWSLRVGVPLEGEDVTASWVAPVKTANGSHAVLKIGMPHMEAEHEIAGLRFWNGDPTVRVLEADEHLNAMLLERCEPGTPLRTLPEEEQDVVVANLLRRLWRTPTVPHPFRPLAVMIQYWADETRANEERWPDAGLVRDGLRTFEQLSREPTTEVLLATDLHAGNVLAARREPWLVIDPKPFIGDPAYDATQHLLNCFNRLLRDPGGTIKRLADLLEIDDERVLVWTFARAAAETHDEWDEDWMTLARALRSD
jgi:streptomycin 6-kinase